MIEIQNNKIYVIIAGITGGRESAASVEILQREVYQDVKNAHQNVSLQAV